MGLGEPAISLQGSGVGEAVDQTATGGLNALGGLMATMRKTDESSANAPDKLRHEDGVISYSPAFLLDVGTSSLLHETLSISFLFSLLQAAVRGLDWARLALYYTVLFL
ncbi:hypothetical protein J1N35_045986 [Gossypium stocksii]|uniref:Uncharacterized protein n=1 Tax=Gossypium stocksii TaxID=47602 RepID=A0A9D3UCJ1_9ROSI|nr:hypothetical protein J1N35_045986 [Gossypium stocksii]